MAEKGKSTNGKPTEVTFHYKKTANYRTFYADGFYGGLTPKGMLYMELYLERQPTPQREYFKVDENKLAKSSRPSEGLSGFIREIEAGITMDYQTMVNLRDWLNAKIEEWEKLGYSKLK